MADDVLRDHLVRLLTWHSAHHHLDDVVADWPADQRGVVPDGLPYSGWQLLEHLRYTQRDILDFSRDPGYRTPHWPDDYWPETTAPPSSVDWDRSVERVRSDLRAMCALIEDPANDLYAPIPHGDGQTLLREAVLLADHNAYHVGQLVVVRRLLGLWPPEG